MKDILIIGGGPAGLTAGLYAARAGFSAAILDKNVYGGQMGLTADIDNYPGMIGTDGPTLASQMYQQVVDQGVEFLFEEAVRVEAAGDTKRIVTPTGSHEAHAVIFAQGARRRQLECPGEARLAGRGVSYCATCDAAFYRGKTVAIVGGGNTALEDALLLANNCEKVYLIHRRDAFRGELPLQELVKNRPNIEIVYNATANRIEGENAVESLVLNTPQGERTLLVSGVFVAIGLVPETAILAGLAPLDEGGYALVGEDCTTPTPGIFVAGDLRSKPLRQIVTAVSDGAVAASAAAAYCQSIKK